MFIGCPRLFIFATEFSFSVFPLTSRPVPKFVFSCSFVSRVHLSEPAESPSLVHPAFPSNYDRPRERTARDGGGGGGVATAAIGGVGDDPAASAHPSLFLRQKCHLSSEDIDGRFSTTETKIFPFVKALSRPRQSRGEKKYS